MVDSIYCNKSLVRESDVGYVTIKTNTFRLWSRALAGHFKSYKQLVELEGGEAANANSERFCGSVHNPGELRICLECAKRAGYLW